jgi:8-oxo-dGTP pyrophosphatase MutT (NUDIX family)
MSSEYANSLPATDKSKMSVPSAGITKEQKLHPMKALDRTDFTSATRKQIRENLHRFQDRQERESTLRAAAVAVTIFEHEGECAVIVTQRAGTLREHGGQWALPGGRIDGSENAIQASLREMREEINLELGESNVVGVLDDYQTRSGYLITPVVLWADIDFDQLAPNPDEVASIDPFTFCELSRSDSPHLESIPESDRPVLSMHFGSIRIYAPTAAVLYQFREVAIFGRPTRVSNYEQPVFAWR